MFLKLSTRVHTSVTLENGKVIVLTQFSIGKSGRKSSNQRQTYTSIIVEADYGLINCDLTDSCSPPLMIKYYGFASVRQVK